MRLYFLFVHYLLCSLECQVDVSSGGVVSLCAPEPKPCLYVAGSQKSLLRNNDDEEDSHGHSHLQERAVTGKRVH